MTNKNTFVKMRVQNQKRGATMNAKTIWCWYNKDKNQTTKSPSVASEWKTIFRNDVVFQQMTVEQFEQLKIKNVKFF